MNTEPPSLVVGYFRAAMLRLDLIRGIYPKDKAALMQILRDGMTEAEKEPRQ